MQVIQMMSSNVAIWCHQMFHCCIATTVVLSTRASNLWRSRRRNFFVFAIVWCEHALSVYWSRIERRCFIQEYITKIAVVFVPKKFNSSANSNSHNRVCTIGYLLPRLDGHYFLKGQSRERHYQSSTFACTIVIEDVRSYFRCICGCFCLCSI